MAESCALIASGATGVPDVKELDAESVRPSIDVSSSSSPSVLFDRTMEGLKTIGNIKNSLNCLECLIQLETQFMSALSESLLKA